MLSLPNHQELHSFFENIVKMNERIEKQLDHRKEFEIRERLKIFSDNAFIILSEIPTTADIDIYQSTIIQEVELVNSIVEKYNFAIRRVFKALKIVLNSLKDFAEGKLKKALTIIEELVDLLEFLARKFYR